MENVIERDTVYTSEELEQMDKAGLQEVLKVREVEFHHLNGEGKLRELIMESNAGPGGVYPEMAKAATLEEKVVEKTDVIVIIELIQPTKTGTIRVRGYTDAEGRNRELLDKNGTPRVVTIRKQEKLNLSIKNDRLLYEHLKDHPVYVLGSDACIRLVNTETQAEDDISKVELAIDAKTIVKGLSSIDLRDFSRVLNISFNSTTTDNVLKSLIYNLTEEDPEKVLDVWNNPDRELNVLIYTAIDKGSITKEKGVYLYEGMVLGNTFEDCVVWIKKNENIIPGMRKSIV